MTRRHGESVYQRGRRGGRAGQWVAVADLGWRDGARDRREFTGPTKQKALERRDAFLHKRQSGFTLPKGRPPYVGEWLEHWLHNVARARVAVTTWERYYRQRMEDYAIPFFSRIRLDELDEADIQAWHAWLARKPARGGKPLAGATIGTVHRAVGAALKEAVVQGKLSRNPCGNVSPPRSRQPEKRPPSLEEARAILARCETWPNGARWVLAIMAGLRQGEALALTWRDVKLDAPPSVTVRQTRSRAAGEWVVKEPKSARSRRSVWLPRTAVAALKRHRAARQVVSLDGLVFTTAAGGPVEATADWRDLRALLASAGLPAYRVHDMRHAFATLHLALGTDARVVQEMMGHSSVSVTRGVYQHVTSALQEQAADAMDRALGGAE